VLPDAERHSDALQAKFSDLSDQFNLPVDDVTQAVYGMGKVFNDLPSALSASQQALFAMKVGELDAATATRTLTAIVNGFQLAGVGAAARLRHDQPGAEPLRRQHRADRARRRARPPVRSGWPAATTAS
jgi:hypothetical protein